MSEGLIFIAGSVLFVLTTSATFLFLMLRFNELYEEPGAELETLEGAERQPDAANGTSSSDAPQVDDQMVAESSIRIDRARPVEPQLAILLGGA